MGERLGAGGAIICSHTVSAIGVVVMLAASLAIFVVSTLL